MLAPLTKKKHRNVENQQTLVQWLQTSASFCHLSHLPQRCVVLCIPRIPFPACLSLSMWHSAEYMLEYAWPILTSCICQRAAVSPFHMACYMLAWTGVGNPGALRGLWPTEAENGFATSLADQILRLIFRHVNSMGQHLWAGHRSARLLLAPCACPKIRCGFWNVPTHVLRKIKPGVPEYLKVNGLKSHLKASSGRRPALTWKLQIFKRFAYLLPL